jgi:hypothetical protein
MPASRIYNPFVGAGSGGGGVGPEAEEVHTYAFSYLTASPATVFSIPANGRILTVGVQITTAFDDSATTITIGDGGNASRLMSAAQNIPDEVGESEAHVGYQYVSSTAILLTLSPGASTQGEGVVYIVFNTNT